MINYNRHLSPVDLDKEFENISEKIKELGLPEGFFEFVPYVIAELFANVKEHSGAKKVGVVVKIDKGNCTIAVADDGIGFRKSYLTKKIYPKDDFAAIEFAVGGLSTKDSQERGWGLYSIKKLVEELRGIMIIKSGDARIEISKNSTLAKHNSKSVRGVEVDLRVLVRKIDFYKFVG